MGTYRDHLIFAISVLLLATQSLTAAQRGIRVQEVLGNDASIPVYHALVIGVNDYQHWASLRQARQDAEKVAETLKSDYGFEKITTLYDKEVTKSALQNTLRKLTRTLGRDDSLLIYYAGHGYYDDLLDVGYWIPTEAREYDGTEPAIGDYLGNAILKTYLDKMEARHVLVISDSCFSGALMRGGRVDLASKENAFYRRAISQPTRWCVTSGDLETVPDQSVFAKKFVISLQYPPQAVFSASDLAGWLKKEVAASSGTQPRFGPIDSSSGSSGGEFVFLHERSGSAQPAAEVHVAQPPTLRAVTGTLIVESPVDGTVSLNGGQQYRIAADRALKWNDLQVGTYTVRVLANSRSWQQAVEVVENKPVSVRATGLEPIVPVVTPVVPQIQPRSQPSYFTFFVSPSSAKVYLDGRALSSNKIEVTPGVSHTVSVQASGYDTHTAPYSVSAGESRPVSVRLKKSAKKKKSLDLMW